MDLDLLFEAVICVAVVLKDEVAEEERMKRSRRKRSCWTTDWLLKRPVEGACAKLFSEWERGLPIERMHFDSCRRMNMDNFAFLLDKVSPLIKKQDTIMRKAISPDIRLNATLYYLATGDSFHSLQIIFRVSKSALHRIIPETAKAIYESLAPDYLKVNHLFALYCSCCFISFLHCIFAGAIERS